jgi:response regulator RpfG family c-di-GMP phosphodiesterase
MFENSEIKIQNAVRPEQTDELFRQRVLNSLERLDLHESVREEIVSRLILLEKESKFNDDSRKIERGMENVLKLLEERHAEQYPQMRFSQKQLAEARIAAILHDIGKSGPVEADAAEQEVIVKIFACENIDNPNQPVMEVAVEIFGTDRITEIEHLLAKRGISAQATMRQFWDQHAKWTHDILERYPQGIDRHARIIAGSHHIDRGINPYNLPETEIPLTANVIGTLEDYVEFLEERALIALDQYEAAIRRGGASHEKALNWVKNNLAKFKKDELMKFVFAVIDELGKEQKIFS